MAKKTKLRNLQKMKKETDAQKITANPLLNKILLSGYQMHDNIILSNFENITQLEVSDNNIDYLDLSSLKKLQILQCERNSLRELIIEGGSLLTLSATNNDLTRISVQSEPCCLYKTDISFNKFKELPLWLNNCKKLHFLSANSNLIEYIPSNIINNKNISLETLQIANNKIRSLPEFTKEKITLRTLSLQCNQIENLNKNLFSICLELTTLNVSCNKLQTLPKIQDESLLENLFASKNQLNTLAIEAIRNLRKIRVLHLAYNNLDSFPSNCIENWTDLEELVISGNKLEKVPDEVLSLKNLKVLKLNSNFLTSLPDFSNLTLLRVMDLAHNHLGKVNLESILPKNIQYLDLSCNQQLQVDSYQLKTFQAKRPISFVDVTGKNRFSLPTSTLFKSNTNSFLPWKLGFSETPGKCPKLWISQLRLPQFCNTECLVGMFDGQDSKNVMSLLPKIIPTILLQQRAHQSNPREYMRYTLISAFERLNTNDRSFNDCGILCHIINEKPSHEFPGENIRRSRRYIIRLAVVGQCAAYLIPRQEPFEFRPVSNKPKFKKYENVEKSGSEAEVFEVILNSEDEYLIICSKNIWEYVRIETVIEEIQKEQNLILAAKKIQDIAQSFGVEQNISIIILKFQNVDSYVDRLISELKQSVRKKSNKNFYNNYPDSVHSSVGNENNPCTSYSTRSYPIGQSDQGTSELSVCLKRIESDSQYFAEPRIASIKPQSLGEDTISRVLEEESDIPENESILSEEQFKCWEYMLEQNTQMLFDKELNKITNLFARKENSSSCINLNSNQCFSQFGLMPKNRMSSSFPQFIHKDVKEHPLYETKCLASKYFGSARSFQQFASMKSTDKNLRDRFKVSEDTNLGYFGSLQQLLPYSFENEFAITHERKLGDDSVECSSRMSQYWGVTSTEL